MANDSNFLLVQMTGNDITQSTAIKQVIRSYLSEKRADQDRDLLAEVNPSGTYIVLTIHHIDD